MKNNNSMEMALEEYQRIEPYLPRQRGHVSMSNHQVVNAILYVTENGSTMESIAEELWKLAYSICSHEPPEQKRCITASF